MSERRNPLEFDALVDSQGKIPLPRETFRLLGARARVRVRLTRGALAALLRRKHVSVQEVDRIAALQLEMPEQVAAFLLSEGALSGKGRNMRRRR
ncbi:MAG TPA: hypothetical protein VL126_07050 [Bacteroidota bacterium]|nr:hypothetical protein [Bacteroidota bacterium]